MDPRKSSQAWLHFERIDDKPDSAKCKICGNVSKRGGGTKNLLDHLQRFHCVVLENGAIATRADGGPGFYEENSPKRKALDRHFLRMFAMDYQPFRVVEDDGFVQFVKALDPRYKLPCRQTISNKLLPGLYEEVKEAIKRNLAEAKHVALTIDAWTSISQDPYLAVTAHYVREDKLKAACLDCVVLPGRHSAENIKKKFLK
ncbi:unnamed protein product [Acanthoscelides obtectus]|uniref:BED-type domain-containing protein n=1 Tax=Acanthoscelides obtectus TaxID=200917 RepID=A0A9P0KIX9_ACAOB|nr:unnamed protein product [Acanthoscelides obtectus]CAK1685441.1 Zinc finger BED domain-containing protein 4 [Acanthoscelides obtectus]